MSIASVNVSYPISNIAGLYVNSHYHYYTYEEAYGDEEKDSEDVTVEVPPGEDFSTVDVGKDYSDFNSEPNFNFPKIPWYGPTPRYVRVRIRI